MDKVDTIIVGAGVVGLAIAAQLSQFQKNVLLIEKNSTFGEETSSRNSEVIHAGIYYPQHSLKAELCIAGKNKLYEYCVQRHIPFKRLGKLLVAHNQDEEAYLQQTINQAKLNGVDDLELFSAKQLNKLEPALSATAALHSPSTGIIDVHSYMQSLLAEAENNQAMFVAQTKLLRAEPNAHGFTVTLDSQGETSQLACQYLINCAGLHSQKVANNIAGLATQYIPQLHCCRGHYFSYSGKSPFSQLIYPIPQGNGLGIHASLDMGGQLKFGPDTQYIDELEYGVAANLKPKFLKAIQKYFPSIDPEKLQPAYSGIRPKLQAEYDSFKDFVIQDQQVHGLIGLINLFGIDSPGLTSSLAIAEQVVKKLI
ncbi:MAG: NAD(P)/FAD-dependent oxidoreductase [Colwellia sp.]|nr:NAD(P)/FAD-dependent oxidoreductase [Colwellia sp.]